MDSRPHRKFLLGSRQSHLWDRLRRRVFGSLMYSLAYQSEGFAPGVSVREILLLFLKRNSLVLFLGDAHLELLGQLAVVHCIRLVIFLHIGVADFLPHENSLFDELFFVMGFGQLELGNAIEEGYLHVARINCLSLRKQLPEGLGGLLFVNSGQRLHFSEMLP